jgi:hypothetical protein
LGPGLFSVHRTGPQNTIYSYIHDEKHIFLMLEFTGKGELYKQLTK